MTYLLFQWSHWDYQYLIEQGQRFFQDEMNIEKL